MDSLQTTVRDSFVEFSRLATAELAKYDIHPTKQWIPVIVAVPVVIYVGKKIVRKIPFFRYGHVADLKSTVDKFETKVNAGDMKEDPRKNFYQDTVQTYYNIVTDFYEYGWGSSFHFAPRFKNESFQDSIVRYEHRVAACLGLAERIANGEKLRILDIGCGIGGPMRNVARFFSYKVQVTGINLTPEHIERAQRYNTQQGARNCDFIQTDFNHLPLADNSVDGLYDFEAICHSPDLQMTFNELFRVLKPGCRFVTAHYCVVNKWDPNNAVHADTMRRFDNIIGTFVTGRTPEFVADTLKKAGFRVVSSEDVFSTKANNEVSYGNFERIPTGTRAAVNAIWTCCRVLEFFGLIPRGSTQVYEVLIETKNLYQQVEKLDIYTPGFLFVAEKPL